MGPSGAILVRKQGSVAEIRLNRPEIMNRFDERLITELAETVNQLADDRSALAVVFSSTGKTFSSGGDMDDMLADADDLQHVMLKVDNGRRLYRAFADFPKPMVVALHGHTYGVATSIALVADAIVSMPGVRLVDPHVQVGLVAGDGGAISWLTNMGLIQAKRHLLWGEPITAEEAHRVGMITELVESVDDVQKVAWELANRAAALPPLAVQFTKRTLNKHLQARMNEVLEVGFYLEAATSISEDLKEAVRAFKEHRTGEWQGR